MSRPKKLSDSDLLHVAYDVSSREGFDSFTLKQVARSANMTPAAVIKRFKSKDNLVYLARRHRWESNLGQFDSGADENFRGLQGLTHFVSLIAKCVDSKRLAEHAVAFGADAKDVGTRRNVAGYFEATRATIGRLLDEAIAKDELVFTGDTVQLAFTLEALIQGSIFQFAFLREIGIERHLQSHVEILLSPYKRRESDSAR